MHRTVPNDDNSYGSNQKDMPKYNKYRCSNKLNKGKQLKFDNSQQNQMDYDGFPNHYHSGFGSSSGYDHHGHYSASDSHGYSQFDHSQYGGGKGKQQTY